MPQKKNPDIAELTRGKAGRLIGNLTGLLATLKGLPLAYNRDLQEDKEPLFDSVEQLELLLPAVIGMIGHPHVPHRPARRAGTRRVHRWRPTSPNGWSGEGIPFRVAHEAAGGCVVRPKRGRRPRPAHRRRTRRRPPRADPRVRDVLTVEGSIASRDARGGTAGERVAQQLDELRATATAARAVLAKGSS